MEAHDVLAGAQPIDLPPDQAPILFVVVDTEEEFDWSRPFSRSATGVTAMRHIGRAQQIFERFGILPTYVVDYPVASQAAGVEPLKAFADAGHAIIGAHLHPWVTPPFDEPVTAAHSFACNLPARLEQAKLEALTRTIEEAFGQRATVYKAGRYGIGARTPRMLVDVGIETDTSVNPHMDYTAEGGPEFRAFDARPCWLAEGTLLEVPCTTGFAGAAGPRMGSVLHATASSPPWSALKAVGVLARLGLTNRIMLSPEGSTLHEMRTITRALLSQGVRTFTLSFHSPSVEPGHTPYVRSSDDLDRFLGDLERYCEFFFAELGGTTSALPAFRARVPGPRSRTE